MRTWILATAATLAFAACRSEEPFTAPTPWETGELVRARLSGSFRAEVDSPHPGAGSFDLFDTPYGDMSRIQVADVGASNRIIQVQILDHSPAGWTILELNVAEGRWQSGSIPLDGNAAVGTLTEPDGSVRYLLRGSLDVGPGGTSPGQVVSGTFSDVDLVEAR